MAEGNANFRRLLDLAKEQSSEKRRELLRDVTDLFLESPAEYSETEREHFGVIMGRVAQDMETAIRRHLATQLAEVGEAPHALIQQLANDEISVAAEVIAKSTVLHEADLVALAKIQGQEHLAAIATRPVVPPSVSDVLVERGNDNVLVKLVNNTGATISRGAMEKVVERSESVAALHAPLIGRKDLPVDLLQDMFSFVSTELRTKITQKMEGMPPDVLEKALAATQSRFRQEVKHIKDADRRAMIFVNDKERSKELTESLLVQLVRSGQELEFSHAFARLGGIDVKTAQRIVKTKNVEGVAIVSKAARFDRSTFTAIALLLIGRESDVKSTQEILELYDQVTAEAAQRVMRFWKVRKEASETPAATASPSTLSHAASA